MITLFGATGYTGRLVARALTQVELPGQPTGLPIRLAGRSPEKLARLADSLPGSPAWHVADATQPATLPALFQDTRVVINCTGPFTDLGEPVVAQAALNGVHYLDTANELGYMYQMRSYDALARKNGAAIVPACGFEVVLADCAAAVLVAEMPPSPGASSHLVGAVSEPTGRSPVLDEVSITYDIGGRGSSIGSRRSALRSLATSWLEYRNGQWGRVLPGREIQRKRLPGGLRPAISFPSSETVTVPYHIPVSTVTTWLAASWHAPYWAPALLPLFARLTRGPAGAAIGAVVSRILLPAEAGLRSQAPFALMVQIHRRDTARSLTLTGKGVYELTAEIVAYAACQMARPGYDQAGFLPPAVALEPRALLDHAVAQWGISLSREGKDA
jgi:hypothetical protein